MKKFILPEKWAVKDCKEVSGWASKKFGSGNYVRENEYLNVKNLGGRLQQDYFFCQKKEGYTEITLDQFKQYVLKQNPEKMKKQDFTIEGTVALKKAFIEDGGFKITSIDYEDYLTSSKQIDNALTSIGAIQEDRINFNLNTQYGEALEYVREYFKTEEPEFKVGDLAVNTDESSNYYNGELGIIEYLSDTHFTFKGKPQSECNHKPLDYLRKPTTLEIEEYNNTKLPEINGYEGSFEKGCLKYGFAELPIRWFKYNKWNRSIKSMVLSSGVEINEEQMNQIRRVVNAKTK